MTARNPRFLARWRPGIHSAAGHRQAGGRTWFAIPGLLACLALAPGPTRAGELPESAADMKALPAYCAARLEKAGPEAFARWSEIIGPNFIHIHHYCFGLHKRRLAMQESDPAERRRLLRSAIGEIAYVESHAVGDIPFYAEIYTVRGKMHLMLGEKIEAATYFKRAIVRDPRHGPAYGALARMFKDQGRVDQARRVITEGLRVAPDSPSLRRLQRQYGIGSDDSARPEGDTSDAPTAAAAPPPAGRPSGDRDAKASRPSSDDQAAKASPPPSGDQAARTARPTSGERTARTSRPSSGERTARTSRPSSGDQATRTALPTSGDRTAETSAPGEDAATNTTP